MAFKEELGCKVLIATILNHADDCEECRKKLTEISDHMMGDS